MGPAASGLHHLEAHLRLALDAGRFGTWRWDRTSGATVWDRRMEELFGLEPGSFEGTYDGWISRVHPADRARVVAAVDDAVARAGTYQFEHRIMHADGTIRWLHAAGAVTTDAEGGVTGTIGCCQDVTARAEADGALKASVARFTPATKGCIASSFSFSATQPVSTANRAMGAAPPRRPSLRPTRSIACTALAPS